MITVLDSVDENRYRFTAMRIVPVSLPAVVALLVVVGCGSSAGANGRRTVIASFYPLAFVAERVGGPSVDVENLTPPGAEPHDIELDPRQVARIQTADAVLYLSHDFQPAVQQAVAGASGKAVDVLASITLRRGEGDEAGRSDPHVWLDPVLFAGIVKRIGAVLGDRAPAKALAQRVLELDRAYRTGLARCRRRDFVTTHAAFAYLAARYGLHQIAITGIDPESEPPPQRLRSLIGLVRRERITTVFFERLVSPKLAETIARDSGAKARILDPIEGLTPAEQSRGASYFSLMRQNLDELRAALGCR
jgi:zinc transport system substrate-binding protein